MSKTSAQVASAVLQSAVRHLHSGQVPENMPCRMREHLQLKRHIGGMLQRQAGGAVYVAGSPGTGKTASVVSTAGFAQQDLHTPVFVHLQTSLSRSLAVLCAEWVSSSRVNPMAGPEFETFLHRFALNSP